MFSKERNAFLSAIAAQNAVITAHIAMRDAGLIGMNDAIVITQKAVIVANAALHAAYDKAAEGQDEDKQDYLWNLAFGGME